MRNSKTKTTAFFLTGLFTFCGAHQAGATVSFANIFTNNMVLQRTSVSFPVSVRVYGTGTTAGEPVTVTFNSQTVMGQVSNSLTWAVTLAAMPYNATGTPLVAHGSSNAVTCSNVVVGDVYLCSGQSNMDYVSLSMSTPNGGSDAATANYPNIRLLHITDSIQQYPLSDIPPNSWFTCTTANSASVSAFSGLAFYIGRDIYQQELGNIPIGLIQSAYSGMPAESFMSQQAILADPYMYPAAVSLSSYSSTPTDSWPTGVYNGMIAPLTGFNIRGVFWDQGETNESNQNYGGGHGWLPSEQYDILLPSLIKDWRMKWNAQLPFYIVQLQNIANLEVLPTPTPCAYWPGASGTGPNYPIASVGIADVRWGQLHTLEVPYTGMSVNFDLNASALNCSTNISYHPLNKEDFAARLSPWAMVQIYGNSVPLSFTGPLYQSCSDPTASSVTIQFNFPNGAGLSTNNAQPVTGFQIAQAGVDPNSASWSFTAATTVGNSIVVTNPYSPNPAMVRYAWGWDPVDPNGPVANLSDSNGYLASPFQTQDDSDMAVTGTGGVTIADLNLTPTTADGTDFGTVGFSAPLTETFTIVNDSAALTNLSLTGLDNGGTSLVRITGGPNAGEFSIVVQPSATSLAAGSSTTFKVAFQPTVAGLAQAILQIPNNTPHKTPYTIYIQATGHDDRTPTPTPTGTWYTATPTNSPTNTPTPSPTTTPNLAVSMIDDFDENNLGTAATRTNLWGGSWGAFAGGGSSINVAYANPGANSTSTCVSIYGTMASGGYCNYLSYLFSNQSAYNAVAAGYTGIEFYVYGTTSGQIVRAQIMSAAVTTYDYLGQNETLVADGQWHLIQIPFSSMAQAGWGVQSGLPPKGTDMTGVKFDTISTGGYAYLLDQVSLYGLIPTPTPTAASGLAALPLGTVLAMPNVLSQGQTHSIFKVLETGATLNVSIYTLDAELVYSGQGKTGMSQFDWDSTGLASGLYLAHVTVTDADGVTHDQNLKVVIIH